MVGVLDYYGFFDYDVVGWYVLMEVCVVCFDVFDFVDYVLVFDDFVEYCVILVLWCW